MRPTARAHHRTQGARPASVRRRSARHHWRTARDEGVLVAYLPGLAMRRIADLHAGEAKTDARDAAIIAEAARSLPHTLRSLRLADEPLAELTMLCGFEDDLAAQITQTSNHIRGLLTQIYPALERVLGPRLDIRPCSICLSDTGRLPSLPQPARRHSPIVPPNSHRAWAQALRPKSFRRSANRR